MIPEPHAEDLPVWRLALPWLDVRGNDEHTLISHAIADALLAGEPDADAGIVRPAILLHDVGWKMCPPEKIARAIGPDALYPEWQRLHEIESVRIAGDALDALAFAPERRAAILAIIDGHDTRPLAISREDSIVKDADKLWRFTAHGVHAIAKLFGWPPQRTLTTLIGRVPKTLLTDAGRAMGRAMILERRMELGVE